MEEKRRIEKQKRGKHRMINETAKVKKQNLKNNCFSKLPFQFVIGPRRESGTLDDLSHLLTTEAEVVNGPHVRKLHHFDLMG